MYHSHDDIGKLTLQEWEAERDQIRCVACLMNNFFVRVPCVFTHKKRVMLCMVCAMDRRS